MEGQQEADVKKKTGELFRLVEQFLANNPEVKKRVLMLRQDVAPIQMIRGKYRFHVLIKTIDHPQIEILNGFVSDLAEKHTGKDAQQVYFELNPSSMV